jgi:hypothetical protein
MPVSLATSKVDQPISNQIRELATWYVPTLVLGVVLGVVLAGVLAMNLDEALD